MLIIAAMFVLVRTLRGDVSYGPLVTPTRICAFAALASFFLISFSGDAYFGVAQRILIGISLTWMLTTSLIAYRLERRAETGYTPSRTKSGAETLTEIHAGSTDLSTT
jgi:hypothetical protein